MTNPNLKVKIFILTSGMLLFIYGFCYNLINTLNPGYSELQSSTELVGFGLVTLSAFLLGKKVIGYVLLALGGSYAIWLLIAVLSG